MSPELILKFQQTFKQLQIHAGLGITEDNISKVTDIAIELAQIADDLYTEVHPMEHEPETEEKVKPSKK